MTDEHEAGDRVARIRIAEVDAALRRWRIAALISYVCFAATVVAGVWINYGQTQDIKRNTAAIVRTANAANEHTCGLVLNVSGVFVDFIKKEIALRAARAAHGNVPADVRDFDKAEIAYWTRHTLPRLAKVYTEHCGGTISEK